MRMMCCLLYSTRKGFPRDHFIRKRMSNILNVHVRACNNFKKMLKL